jgi:hypothetical protein
MFRTIHVAVLATALALTALPAQTRTQAAACGTHSSVCVINFGQVTATVQNAPGCNVLLWSEGTFLNYGGQFYETQMESYSFGPARVGLGLMSLRVGGNTVRSVLAGTAAATPRDSVRMDVWGGNRSKTFNVAGIAVVVSGNVNVNLSGDCQLAWPANGVIIDGIISGDGTGRASAALASPVGGVTATAPNTIRLGRQQMRGRGEVFAAGNFSALRYDMDPMTVQLSASLNLFGVFTLTSSLVNATRAAISIANFR